MKREILFRGKIKGNKTKYEELNWAFGNLVQELETGRCFISDLSHFDKSTKLDDVIIEVDPETVCQYTGLTDKNGRKIFENDICDRKEEFPEIVTYHDGDWTLDYSYASGKERGYNYCNLGFYVRNRGEVEVIGNVFDNPELLRGA